MFGRYALVAVCLGGFSLAKAAEVSELRKLKDLSIEQIMEIEIPTVYGASKHQQKITEAPASVTIVTREEIQNYGHRTLADVLRSSRDFYVSSDRSSSFVGVRGFNRPGDYGGRILFLVDGHRVNEVAHDSVGSGTHFPVDIDMVERVEMIRGPGAVLYGNNAFFGVVNVITRKGADLNGLEASAEAGTFDTYKGRVSYGKKFENGVSLTVTGSALDTNGGDVYLREFDSPSTNRGIASGQDHDRVYTAGAVLSYGGFTLQSNYMRGEQGNPIPGFSGLFNEPYMTSEERSSTRLSYAHQFSNGTQLNAKAYWDTYQNQVDFSKVNQFGAFTQRATYRDFAKAQWWGIDLDLSKQFDRHRVTFGANYRDASKLEFLSGDWEPRLTYFQLDGSSTTFGAFVQDEWKIAPRLTLNAGLAFDWFDNFGSTISPRGALIFQPADQTTVKLIYGQAFRAPTVFESQFAIPASATRVPLEPEQIRTTELVLEQGLTRNTRLTASLFHNQISDLISLSTDQLGSQFFYTNSGDAETTGGSIELEGTFARGIKGRASYTLQHTTDGATGARLSNSPEHLAKLNLTVPFYREKVFGGVELQYMSETDNPRGEKVGGHFLTNLTLYGREIVPGLDAAVSVYNLFDVDYSYPGGPEHRSAAIPQEGRTFRLKFTYKF